MPKRPWFKFYPQDWMGDPELRACSPAARGVWADMISLAHQASPYGHVLVNGNAPDLATLARLTGCGDAECETLVAELERNGVFSRTRKGVIYSRRMVRDAKKAVHAQQIGKLGGNPSLSKQTGISPQVNPPDKPQKPEARGLDNNPPAPDGAVPPSNRKAKTNAKRATRLDPDWRPDERCCAFATEHGYSGDEIRAIADSFVEYWANGSGHNKAHKDWNRTWQNWIRTSPERGRPPGFLARARADPRSGGPEPGGLATALRRTLDRAQDVHGE